MPVPSGAALAARGGVRNESNFDDVFVKPLGRRNEPSGGRKSAEKMDKLKSAYGTRPKALAHPHASRPSTSNARRPSTSSSARPATSSSARPSTSNEQRPSTSAARKAQIRAMAPAPPKTQPDVLENFNVTVSKLPSTNDGTPVDIMAKTIRDQAEQHDTMMKILSSRALQLRAARALRSESYDAVIQHIVKMDDVTLAVDVLPVITQSIEAGVQESDLSLPVCVEMLPILRSLVDSPYEDYQMVVFNFLTAAIDHWRKELWKATRGGMASSISSQGFAVGLIGMGKKIKDRSADRASKVASTARKLSEKIDSL